MNTPPNQIDLRDALLALVREVAENAVEKYKDSISTGIPCGCPAPGQWPDEREQKLADDFVAILNRRIPSDPFTMMFGGGSLGK